MDTGDRIVPLYRWFAAPLTVFDLPTVHEMAVYLYLQCLAGSGDEIVVSVCDLAAGLKVADRTVRNVLARLRQHGAIIRVKQRTSNGHNAKSRYFLTLDGRQPPAPNAVRLVHQRHEMPLGNLQVVVGRSDSGATPQDRPPAPDAAPSTTTALSTTLFRSTVRTTTPSKEREVREVLEVLLGESGFQVPAALLTKWQGLFPLVDVEAELAYVAEYARTRPEWTRRRRSWRLTLLNWLKHEHEKAARRNGKSRETIHERYERYQREDEGRRKA